MMNWVNYETCNVCNKICLFGVLLLYDLIIIHVLSFEAVTAVLSGLLFVRHDCVIILVQIHHKNYLL